MSKYAKIALLTLAAVLLLGFTITTNAAPPWLEDREQLIVSAPLWGDYSTCMVTNTTDSTIDVIFTIIDHGGGIWDSIALSVHPGYYPREFDYEAPPAIHLHMCKVSWLGQPGDIRASYCRYSDASFTYDAACVELH